MKFDIVYASDDNYAFMAGVSMQSLFESNRDAEAITIHFFEDGIGAENRAKLEATAADFGRTIVFYDVRERLKQISQEVTPLAIVSEKGEVRGSFTVYGRICIGEILPADIERALYLDCDTFVDGDLSPLFGMKMDAGSPIAMGLDAMRPEYKHHIGFATQDPYFNSGVVLFDLPTWRKGDFRQKLLAHMAEKKSGYLFADQDYLNYALKGRITSFPIRFNFLSQYFLYMYSWTKYVYDLNTENGFCDQVEFDAAQKQAAIYHFSGHTFVRPFYTNSIHPIKERYNRVYRSSQWRDRPQTAFQESFSEKVRQFLYKYAPCSLAAFIARMALKRAIPTWFD